MIDDRSNRTLLAGLVALLLLVGCQSMPARDNPCDPPAQARRDRVALVLDRVRAEIRPLSPGEATFSTESELEYFQHYGLDLAVTHEFGSVDTGPDLLAVHIFRPEHAQGTVFFVHGYFDHTGTHARTIRALVQAGFAVVSFDLPGHGLSGGERAVVEKMSDYADALQTVVNHCATSVPTPLHFVGHSTGCIAVLDPLLVQGAESVPFERIVLAAPLIHSAYWTASRIGTSLAGWFTDDVARRAQTDSSDAEFIRFRRFEDPLQYGRFPLEWFDALEAWQERIENATPVNRQMLVLQGDEDDIVSWKYNLRTIEEMFPRAKIVRIQSARHQLLNESDPIRESVVDQIIDCLARVPARSN